MKRKKLSKPTRANVAEKADGVKYHEDLAAEWDDRYLSGAFHRRAELFRNQFLPLVSSSQTWLDAGCGSGYFSRMLAERQASIVGVDASQNMILEARRRAVDAGLDDLISFEKITTVEALSFDDASFDGCICLSVLEYLADPYDSIDEITRVLKPGGWFVLSVPHRQSALRFVQRVVRSISGAGSNTSMEYLATSLFSTTLNELRFELEKRDFEDVRIECFDALIPKWLHVILPPSLIYVAAKKV